MTSTSFRQLAVVGGFALMLAACTGEGTADPTTEPAPITPSSSTTVDEAPTTTTPATTSTTTPPVTTTTRVPETSYAVVAWESGRSLVIVEEVAGGGAGCPAVPEPISEGCGILTEIGRVELADPPHNLTVYGSLVFASHPTTGRVTRVDLSTGEVITVPVGVEPHDLDFSEDGTRLFITDEGGRRLIELDPASLEQVAEVALPGRGHDSVVANGGVWTTLVGRDEFAFVTGTTVQLFPTGASPHDLLIDSSGKIWFSNWGSARLMVFDPETSATQPAPAGVSEPHHFSLDADGHVWVSDNGGDSVVTFTPGGPVETIVGAAPHHLALLGELMVVAVSGNGEIVAVADQQMAARLPVGTGLHGAAVGETAEIVLPP